MVEQKFPNVPKITFFFRSGKRASGIEGCGNRRRRERGGKMVIDIGNEE